MLLWSLVRIKLHIASQLILLPLLLLPLFDSLYITLVFLSAFVIDFSIFAHSLILHILPSHVILFSLCLRHFNGIAFILNCLPLPFCMLHHHLLEFFHISLRLLLYVFFDPHQPRDGILLTFCLCLYKRAAKYRRFFSSSLCLRCPVLLADRHRPWSKQSLRKEEGLSLSLNWLLKCIGLVARTHCWAASSCWWRLLLKQSVHNDC